MNRIFNQTSLARVWRATQGENLGLITAFRNDRSDHENQSLKVDLFNAIQLPQWGVGYIETERHFVDNSKPTETLFIVTSDEEDDGRFSGRRASASRSKCSSSAHSFTG